MLPLEAFLLAGFTYGECALDTILHRVGVPTLVAYWSGASHVAQKIIIICAPFVCSKKIMCASK
jgi:hypothetical protein